jgi:hypothetical protein
MSESEFRAAIAAARSTFEILYLAKKYMAEGDMDIATPYRNVPGRSSAQQSALEESC